MAKAKGAYSAIIERIFQDRYRPGMQRLLFEREDIETTANLLKIARPKNLGDVIYNYRFRLKKHPQIIRDATPSGKIWLIKSVGISKHAFVLANEVKIVPTPSLLEIKIPDATPSIISMYKLSDEQALLAILRYNRLIDIFTGVATYSLQSHLQTKTPEVGGMEIDEVYVGVDQKGTHYIFPVQAKRKKDKISPVQIEQDVLWCRHKLPNLLCKPIAAQFMESDIIALFMLEYVDEEIKLVKERHYRLCPKEKISESDLKLYQSNLD